MDDIKKIELIEKYLEGQLTGKELADVEERIRQDSSFSNDVEWQQQAMEQLVDPGMRLFQERMHSYRQEKNTNLAHVDTEAKTVQMRPRRKWLAVAAAVLLLAVAGYWVYQQGQPDADVLYADSHTIHPDELSKVYEEELNNPSRSGLIENRKPDFINAMKSYPDNTSLLEAYVKEYPEDRMGSFYLAQAYMNNGTFEKAEELLIILKNDPEFEDPAAVNWYLALTYLKQRKMSKSKKLLKELSTGNTSDYQVKATQLLEKWNK